MRKDNWQHLLADVLASAQLRPFAWGENDCCLFASDCAMAITGIDPAANYRDRYTTEIGAKRVLHKEHGSIEAAFDACFDRVEPNFAKRGDLVLFEGALGKTVGVIWASQIWTVGESGVGAVRDRVPYVAWSVE
ncbi:hypothetical protein [Vibrio sp. SCSIO 43136]|uniref:DUF6950 family protein n=1 Tax=Vibrio sp. SCSIO 43136 TaxID=2819101 RepID=UPI002075EC3D|nr:hypothetical protein [Vibrio sp. SCSIO 43136]USD68141.1 hypothetical protein J4N39_18375 [Vibrio sp. SCSIO 43136]